MCWSAPVSATFGVLQLITAIALFLRNRHYDRYSVIAVSPIIAQEFCQMMIWFAVGESESPTVCQAMNTYFSIGYQRASGLVPLSMCFVCYEISSQTVSDTSGLCRKGVILACGVVVFVGYIHGRWLVFSNYEKTICGSPGPCGHLSFNDLPQYTITTYYIPLVAPAIATQC